MSSEVPDIYSFFSDFKKYMQYDSHIEKHSGTGEHNNTCDAFIIDVQIPNPESANQICAKFKNLYKFIISTKKPPKNKSLDKNDFAYLNYWINRKLRNTKISNELTVKEFHKKLNNHDDDFVGYDMFAGKLFDIGENDFQNIELLINLENQYGVIFENVLSRDKDEGKISCLKYYKDFVDKYKEGISRCPNNTNFCNALNIYNEIYEKVYVQDIISEKCIDKEIPKLPTYDDVSLSDKKITVVGTVLGPSFGILFTLLFFYKLTPFGRWIRNKTGINKEAQSIPYEEHDQSFLSTSDNKFINSDSNEYHLFYDSVKNY
ncbi:PIR Superfamily Protein [Plasmodium ovale wallikeri]|uniref:PIR Superfamily Protein n=1 Tax=Plasmodium ovale wallikeri TaxID=864142 RepID=A0A1A9AE74_PLAOA|nr:PIR Superfamily Protein [Plasmodium ovale wallikeri]SBT58045.1 PIR Superfamily Protein [Plasmodium ovale wallikeri]